MTVLKEVTVHEWSGGLGHGEGGHLVISTLLREGNLEPVGDWSTINFGSDVYNGPLETSPHLDRSEVPLNENSHVRVQEVFKNRTWM